MRVVLPCRLSWRSSGIAAGLSLRADIVYVCVCVMRGVALAKRASAFHRLQASPIRFACSLAHQ